MGKTKITVYKVVVAAYFDLTNNIHTGDTQMKNSMEQFNFAPANADSRWWSAVMSQVRDTTDNANCSPLDSARQLREWAASRADSPAFAALTSAAREQAARTVWANRPQPV